MLFFKTAFIPVCSFSFISQSPFLINVGSNEDNKKKDFGMCLQHHRSCRSYWLPEVGSAFPNESIKQNGNDMQIGKNQQQLCLHGTTDKQTAMFVFYSNRFNQKEVVGFFGTCMCVCASLNKTFPKTTSD